MNHVSYEATIAALQLLRGAALGRGFAGNKGLNSPTIIIGK
jgi:hypothetical protein